MISSHSSQDSAAGGADQDHSGWAADQDHPARAPDQDPARWGHPGHRAAAAAEAAGDPADHSGAESRDHRRCHRAAGLEPRPEPELISESHSSLGQLWFFDWFSSLARHRRWPGHGVYPHPTSPTNRTFNY